MSRIFLPLLLALAVTALHAAVPASVQPSIEQARRTLAAQGDLADTRRTELTQRLDAALAADTQATELLAEAAKINSEAKAEPARIATLESGLERDPAETFRQWRQALDTRQPSQLAQQLSELRAAAANDADRNHALDAELDGLLQRPATLAQELDQARRDAEAAAPAGTTRQSDTERLIASLAAQATQRQHQARIEKLSAERAALPERTHRLELEQRALQRHLTLAQRQIEVLEALLAQNTDEELGELGTRLEAQAAQAATDPELAAQAQRNLALWRQLADSEADARRIAEQTRTAQSRFAETSETLRNTRSRLALGDADETVGLILLNERRRLENPLAIAQALSQARRKLAQVQLRLIDLEEQATALAAADPLANIAQGDEETPVTTSQHALQPLLEARIGLVARLKTAERARLSALNGLEAALAQQHDTATTLSQLLDRELLWFPSHDRVGAAWFSRLSSGWADLFKPSRYATSLKLLPAALERQWPLALSALVLLFVLTQRTRRLPERLAELAQPLARVRTDRYRYTVQALFATLAAALVWPLPLALLGWLLRQAGQAGKFSDSLGSALITSAGALFFYAFLRWLIAENGVARRHFRWTAQRRDAIRACLPWFLGLLLPSQFLLLLAFVREQEPAFDAVARLMLILICAVSGWQFWKLLAPGALWSVRGVADPEPVRLRQVLRVALPLCAFAIVHLTLFGYVLSATLLVHAFWLSLTLIVALSILHGLVSRWLLLGERRLALKRLDLRRGTEAATTESAAGEAPDIDPESELMSSATVSQQTRRLLRAVTLCALVIGLIWVWADVLPALGRLNAINMWSVSGLDANGKPILEAVTLGALIAGVLVLAFTFIAARNLPGLVELGLLSRTHLDSGARYAFTSLCRYLVVIVGTLIGLGLLGVRWSQLQWLAAALTVGLGFGLQEIFANFVSGLIILFERPFRVGDLITIGEVEGKVTRIRTRATTVLDSDNREVVVPNKTFITSRFVNWTLTDTVTRLVFKLSLAQDANPATVRELLLQLAREEPLVLQQPAPGCAFTQITTASYDFELRVFVAELAHRAAVQIALNQRIAAALREHGLATSRPGEMKISMESVQP